MKGVGSNGYFWDYSFVHFKAEWDLNYQTHTVRCVISGMWQHKYIFLEREIKTWNEILCSLIYLICFEMFELSPCASTHWFRRRVGNELIIWIRCVGCVMQLYLMLLCSCHVIFSEFNQGPVWFCDSETLYSYIVTHRTFWEYFLPLSIKKNE